MSVATRRAQLAERTVVTAISSVGQVVEEVRVARMEVVVVAADAQSAVGMVRKVAAPFSAETEATTATAIGKMEERVQQVAAYSDAQTSRAAAMLKEQLESKIHGAATSTAETTEIRMHDTVEGVRRNVQATLSQNLADARQKEEKRRRRLRGCPHNWSI